MRVHAWRAGVAAALVLLAFGAQGCPAPRRQPPPRTAAEAAPGPAGEVPIDPEDGAPATVSASPASPASSGAPAEARGVPIQHGRATYYADRFTGRSTASGEPYDPRALTAAHRTLPFGAIVDVVRRDGRRVRVRINDRGPFVRDKIIDLSRSAAQAIGLVHDGIAQVTIELVSRPPRRR